jgi:hypothetical protein
VEVDTTAALLEEVVVAVAVVMVETVVDCTDTSATGFRGIILLLASAKEDSVQ